MACGSCGGGGSSAGAAANVNQAVQYKHVRPDGHTEFYDYMHQAQYWKDRYQGEITTVDRKTGDPV